MSMDRGAEMTRRRFLALGGMTLAGWALAPKWARAAAAAGRGSRKILVVLFQRGAADGLNIIPPYADPAYRKARPSIRIMEPGRPEGALDLDGTFGLHPRLSPLLPLWKEGRFAVVHAAGSPDATRSHFDAQDCMESGTPGLKATQDGWLNRALTAGKVPREALAAVALAGRTPRTMQGAYPVMAVSSADQLRGGGASADSFETVYEDAVDDLLSGPARDLGRARKAVAGLDKADGRAVEARGYPKGKLGRDFFEVARLIKADVGLRVGFLEAGGWDHHFNEGSTQGQLARRLEELGGSIAAFYKDLGSAGDSVLLLTMTEFGRTLEENGNGGTDHGHGSVMTLFGPVKGGKVHGRWPGLGERSLYEARDLAVTTDYRSVVSEVLRGHLGLTDLSAVFPDGPDARLGLL
jgi:uncharacterized protein (DUF1501 family)